MNKLIEKVRTTVLGILQDVDSIKWVVGISIFLLGLQVIFLTDAVASRMSIIPEFIFFRLPEGWFAYFIATSYPVGFIVTSFLALCQRRNIKDSERPISEKEKLDYITTIAFIPVVNVSYILAIPLGAIIFGIIFLIFFIIYGCFQLIKKIRKYIYKGYYSALERIDPQNKNK